jgi:hypothetical protein
MTFANSGHKASALAITGLFAGALLFGCSAAPTHKTPGTQIDASGSTGGAPATGGSLGSVGTGGNSGGSGGSLDTGGNPGTGGSAASGGSSGGDDASTGGDTGGSSGSDGGAPPASSDGGAPVGGGGNHPLTASNALVQCKISAKYRLPGASAADFCAFYEKYCPYDPTQMMTNKGQTPAQAGKGTAPWFYKDYEDCIAKYMAATPAQQSCRAGQLCNTNFMAKPLAQGCTHSTGHFDPPCYQ